MLLRCPHCKRSGEHVRSDFFGDWVVCSVCELPFAWREARAEENGNGNGNGRHAVAAETAPTRDER
jgi:hypothetical protein